ncbi:nephrin-like [Mytilus edulis]|uniref:nephrin-like n=1 Tax=Mytilus edulis TaxID=6550 RepID=UPI0039F14497
MVVSGKTYNTSTEYIYHETFKCIGIEVRLVDCPRYSVRCPSESKAAVVCDPTRPSVELHLPLPLIIDEPVNLKCIATGGSPVPDIWWNCFNNENGTLVILSENQIVSVLEIRPSRSFNDKTCTCFVHQTETTLPVTQRVEKLVVYYPVRGDLNVTVPLLIENQSDTLTCEASDGNPLPDIWWTCSGIPYDNVTSAVTHNSSTSILHLTPTSDYHNKTCTCFGRQNNTMFAEISKSTMLRVLYTVEEVILSSTNLLVGIRSYLICSVTGGNPEPVAKWESDGVLQNTYSIRSSDAIVAMLPIIPTRDHNGRRYTCVVNQPDTSFKIISKSLVLRVTDDSESNARRMSVIPCK